MKFVEVVVIGKRRWSRTLYGEIKKLSNLYDLKLSSVDTFNELRATTASSQPDNHNSKCKLAVVANSSYLHYETCLNALELGFHVLCEKPIVYSTLQLRVLHNLAATKDLNFICTHTFLYSESLRFLGNYLSANDSSNSNMHLFWSDPKPKDNNKAKYDSTSPFPLDIACHLHDILMTLFNSSSMKLIQFNTFEGGASFLCTLLLDGNINVTVHAGRNSKARQRSLTLHLNQVNYISLSDFSDPCCGFNISGQSEQYLIPPKHSLRPIHSLLISVFELLVEGRQDIRHSHTLNYSAQSLQDSLLQAYVDNRVHKHQRAQSLHVLDENTYSMKEVASIKQRSLSYLPPECPLINLVHEYSSCQ